MDDDEEIASYMFRRTVPSMHITPDDVRMMVGALLLFDLISILFISEISGASLLCH